MISPDDIAHRFAFHAATTQERKDEHTSARQILRRAADELNELVPDGREKSIVVTKLEEAMMWANAGIARDRTEDL
jgi:hypothetical protein